MKNLSLILNAILIIAVGYLYFNEFSDDDSDNNTQVRQISNSSGKLAYVNSDTLLAHYNYYEEVAQSLETKRERLQQEYSRRAAALQQQIDDFQRTYTNLTVPQARAVEEDLLGKRQELALYQETITQELMKEEASITQNLYGNISSFLKTYGDENGLEIVFTFSAGSGLLYANEGLDITDQVISALNENYLNEDQDQADSLGN